MLNETLETFGYLTAAAFYYFSDDSPGIVKPDGMRNTADILEHSHETFKQAFHVFTIV